MPVPCGPVVRGEDLMLFDHVTQNPGLDSLRSALDW